MSGSTANPTDVEPSSILNSVGCGYDAADTNLQLMHGTTITKVNLGAAFAKGTTDRSQLYYMELSVNPESTTVTYLVKEIVSGAVASGIITLSGWTNTTLLAPRVWARWAT